MYENYKLCETLKPSDVCIVVEQYDKGNFTQQFHEHVPKLRLSDDARRNLMRALVMCFSEMGGESIVRCHLNSRGKIPAADNRLNMVTSYPEPGVFRTYCGTNTKSWIDQVITPDQFRIS